MSGEIGEPVVAGQRSSYVKRASAGMGPESGKTSRPFSQAVGSLLYHELE